jgi:hypothetical protein
LGGIGGGETGGEHGESVVNTMARAGLWAALAFVFNLVWEIAQVRLYTI